MDALFVAATEPVDIKISNIFGLVAAALFTNPSIVNRVRVPAQ